MKIESNLSLRGQVDAGRPISSAPAKIESNQSLRGQVDAGQPTSPPPATNSCLKLIRLNLIRLQRCDLTQKLVDYIQKTKRVSTFIHELCEFAINMSDKMERYAEVCVALGDLLPSSILVTLQCEVDSAFKREVLVHQTPDMNLPVSTTAQLLGHHEGQTGMSYRGMRLVHICRFIAHLASKGLYNVEEAKEKFAEASRCSSSRGDSSQDAASICDLESRVSDSSYNTTIPICPSTPPPAPPAPPAHHINNNFLTESSSLVQSTSVIAASSMISRTLECQAHTCSADAEKSEMHHIVISPNDSTSSVIDCGTESPPPHAKNVDMESCVLSKADLLAYRCLVAPHNLGLKVVAKTRDNSRIRPKRVFTRSPTEETISTCCFTSLTRSGSEMSWQRTSSVETEDSVVISERCRPKWAPSRGQDPVAKSIMGLLNKLTVEKFDVLSQKLMELDISSEEQMSTLVKGIFGKVTLEHLYISMYTNLCTLLLQWFEQRDEKLGKLFRKSIVNGCQKTFEVYDQAEFNMGKTDEDYGKYVKEKERMMGNLKFIGELACQRIIKSRVVDHCIEALMEPKSEIAIEGLVVFLSTIGPVYNIPNPRSAFPKHVVYGFLDCDLKSANCSWSTRVKCLVMDMLDEDDSKWPQGKKSQNAPPSKLADIRHQWQKDHFANSRK
eukprot:GEMP01009374.1.p1 GENE.GEMP01009374.1~~GEMP01009374.1.p1  ORF type:complete len:669 (+),score=85.70 GEMP01009374.1:111-2117(+)